MVSPLWVWGIVSRCSVETIIQVDGRKQAELEWETGSELLDDLPGSETSLVRVGPSQVEIELIERRLGQKVGAVVESFQVKELVFDEAVDGFDVGLIGMRGGGDARMLGAEVSDGSGEVRTRAVGLEFADELGAVVGLPGEVAEVDAAALEVDLDALGDQDAGLSGARVADARNCKPLRTSRAVYCTVGKPRAFI